MTGSRPSEIGKPDNNVSRSKKFDERENTMSDLSKLRSVLSSHSVSSAMDWFRSVGPRQVETDAAFSRWLRCGELRQTMVRLCNNPWICPTCRAVTLLQTTRESQQRVEAQRTRDRFSVRMQLVSTSYTTEVPVEELPEAFRTLAQRPPLIGRCALRVLGRAGLTITVPGLNESQPISTRTEIYFLDADDILRLPRIPHRERYSRESWRTGKSISRRTEIRLCGPDAALQPPNGSFSVQRYSRQRLANLLADAFAYSPGILSSRDIEAKTAVWNALLGASHAKGRARFASCLCQWFGWIRDRRLDDKCNR